MCLLPNNPLSLILRTFLLAGMLSFAFSLGAQTIKCGNEITDQINYDDPNDTRLLFEEWMSKKTAEYKTRNAAKNTEEVWTIPVIFHVVHNGEEVGEGANLSPDLIYAQINQLNNDFNFMGFGLDEDGNSVGASVNIRFCPVAYRYDDVELPEPGISRIPLSALPNFNYSSNLYVLQDLLNIVSWNPDEYLNIMIAPNEITDSNPFNDDVIMGYANFPDTDILDGLPSGGESGDGIILDFRIVGSDGLNNPSSAYPDYRRGKILTHEIGHWLGLRHTWGDAYLSVFGCNNDDYCEDTPNQYSANSGVTPIWSCGSQDMIQNHMDYTADVIKNTFTEEQKIRIRTILDPVNNVPRRGSLLSSSRCCGTQNNYQECCLNDEQEEQITLFNPQAPATYNPGDEIIFEWNYCGANDVNIYISSNGGASYDPDPINEDLIPNNSTPSIYQWPVPCDAPLGTDIRFRVQVANFNNFIFDDTDNLAIQEPDYITMLSPLFEATLLAGTDVGIEWLIFDDDPSQYDIYFEYDNGGAIYITDNLTPVSGFNTLVWSVPDNISGTGAIVIANTEDECDRDFAGNITIENNGLTIEIIQPNSSSIWYTNTSNQILFNVIGNSVPVGVFLKRSGELIPHSISGLPTTAITSGYIWDIPSDLQLSSEYQLVLHPLGNDNTSFFSDIFTITEAPINSSCNNAIQLPLSNDPCEENIFGITNHYGYNNYEDPECANYYGGDLWFKFTMPSSGAVMVETWAANNPFDTALELYTGNCTGLSKIPNTCSDWGEEGMMAGTTLNNHHGETIYARVWNPGNIASGIFNICVFPIENPCLGDIMTFADYPDLSFPIEGLEANYQSIRTFGDIWDDESCGGPNNFHNGVDIQLKANPIATAGKTVHAAFNGEVVAIFDAGANAPYDWRQGIVIEHNYNGKFFTTSYLHLEEATTANVGDFVFSGQQIGVVADVGDDGTNNHLHFGIRGRSYDDNNSNNTNDEESSIHTAHVSSLPQVSDNGCDCTNFASTQPLFPEYFIDPEFFMELETGSGVGGGSGSNSLETPLLVSPASNTTLPTTPVNHTWQNVPGADRYRIQIAASNTDWTDTDGFPAPLVNQLIMGDIANFTWSGAQPGQTYYWTVRAGNNNTVQGSPYASPWQYTIESPASAPDNDEPCYATSLGAASATCNNVSGTLVGATNSINAPAPNCGNYGGNDVWFLATVPTSGNFSVSLNDVTVNDPAMAAYDGTCNILTEIACVDDSNGGPIPILYVQGQQPGTNIWIRVWSENGQTGTFDICSWEGIGDCNDGVQSPFETGVDCGGYCPPCAPEPSCSDGIQNGDETGVDCGGDCLDCPSTTALISPNGGENWTAGTTATISWDIDPSFSYVRLGLSIDDGSSWIFPTDVSLGEDDYSMRVPNTGSFNWDIPCEVAYTLESLNSTNCLIGIFKDGTGGFPSEILDVSDAAFTIDPCTGGADLEVMSTNIQQGTSFDAGQSFYLEVLVANTGTFEIGAQENGSVAYVLSEDNTFSSDDIILCDDVLGGMPPGDDDLEWCTAMIPAAQPNGAYFLLFIADHEEVVSEVNEDNNVLAVPVVVGDLLLPDLVINSVATTSSSGSLLPGNEFEVTIQIENNGSAIAGSTHSAFYISSNTTLDENDIFLDIVFVDDLTIGQTSTISTILTLPLTLPPGDLYLITKADYNGYELEDNELNNIFSYPITIADQVDLVGVHLQLSQNLLFTNSNETATVTILNEGNIPSSSCLVSLYISQNPTLDGGDPSVGDALIPLLLPGESIDVDVSILIPSPNQGGAQYIIASIDDSDIISEFLEINNLLQAVVTISDIGLNADVNHASCGSSNGSITLTPLGGSPPYTFNWGNGATESTINNLVAGNYHVTVSDNNGSTINRIYSIYDNGSLDYDWDEVQSTQLEFIDSYESFDNRKYVLYKGPGELFGESSTGDYSLLRLDPFGNLENFTSINSSFNILNVAADAEGNIFFGAYGPTNSLFENMSISPPSWFTGGAVLIKCNSNLSPLRIREIGLSYTINGSATGINVTDLLISSDNRVIIYGEATQTSQIRISSLAGSENQFYSSGGRIDTQKSYIASFDNDLVGAIAGFFEGRHTTQNPFPSYCYISHVSVTEDNALIVIPTCQGGGVFRTWTSIGSNILKLESNTIGVRWNVLNSQRRARAKVYDESVFLYYPDQNVFQNPQNTISKISLSNGASISTYDLGFLPLSFSFKGENTVAVSNASFISIRNPNTFLEVQRLSNNGQGWFGGTVMNNEDLSFSLAGRVVPPAIFGEITSEPGNYVGKITPSVVPSFSVSLPQNLFVCSEEPIVLQTDQPNMDHSWSTGSNSNNISATTGGTYSVTVTDGNGCSATDEIVITEADISATINTTTDHCNSNVGSVTVSATGGIAPYSYSWSDGLGTSSIIRDVQSGNYSVTINDTNGCSITESITVPNTTAPEILITSNSATNCGLPNGSATVSITTAGEASYTVFWSDGGTGSQRNDLSPGNYTITATDQWGCSSTTTLEIGENMVPTATITSTTLTSCITPNASATFTGSGGSLPYDITWNTGQTGTTISDLPAGVYSAQAVDANGCVVSGVVEIEDYAYPTISLTAAPATCGATVSGQISTSGGISPFSFEWSNGATASTANNLSTGTYLVTVTDGQGCEQVEQLLIDGTPVLEAVIYTTSTSCSSLGAATVEVLVGESEPSSYSWSTGQSTESISNLAPGNYSCTVTSNGCTQILPFTISGPNILAEVDLAVTNDDCGEGAGKLIPTITGGTPPYTYQWSTGANTAILDNLSAGTYELTVTDFFGCSINSFASVQSNAPLQLSLVAIDAICGNPSGSVSTSVSGGDGNYTYQWNTGASNPDLNTVAGGTYTLIVTDGGGCTISASETVAFSTGLEGYVSAEPETCQGQGTAQAFIIGGSGNYTYSWGSANTTLSAGSYTLQVSDDNGCILDIPFTVGSIEPMTISAAATQAYCGQANAQASVFINDGTAPYDIQWSNGAQTATASNLAVGFYDVQVTDALGCTASANVQVVEPFVNFALEVQVNNEQCSNGNGSASVIPQGGQGPHSFEWSSLNGNGALLQNVPAGVYFVTVTDALGCSETANVPIGISGGINLNVTSTDANCGEFTGSASVNAASGSGDYNYLWSNGATTASIENLAPGSYDLVVWDSNGCYEGTTVEIGGGTLFDLVFSPDPGTCGNANGSVSVSASTNNVNFVWNTGASGPLLTGITAGMYTVTATSPDGCVVEESVFVSNSGNPGISLLNITVDSCSNGNGAISIYASSPAGGLTYAWDNGSSSSSVTGLSAGNYSVLVSDANGCSSTATFAVPDTPGISIEVSSTPDNCNDQNGSASVSVTTESDVFQIQWDNGSISNEITGLAAGDYIATITDDFGCEEIITATVTAPVLLSAAINPTTNFNGSPISCFEAADANLRAQATGGTAPFTYLWNSGETTASLENQGPGTYSVTITDVNGCVTTEELTIDQPAPLTATAEQTQVVSNENGDNGAATASASGGTAPYTYLWSSGGTEANVSGLSEGTFTVTITDANGCASIASVQILVYGIAASTTDVSCNGGTDGQLAISVLGGEAPYSFSWTNLDSDTSDDGTIVDNSSTVTLVDQTVAGNYSITLTDNNGLESVSQVTIEEPAPISLSEPAISMVSCAQECDGAITIVAQGGVGGFTYNWSNGDNNQSINSLCPATYQLTVSDANGCTLNKSFTIEEPEPLTVTENQVQVSCFGGSDGAIQVQGGGGVGTLSFTWSNNGNGTENTNLTAGTYELVIQDENNCVLTTSYEVTEPTVLSLSLTAPNISCSGEEVMINSNVTGGTGSYTYNWENGATTSSIISGAGTYHLEVTDENGCVSSQTITLESPAPLALSANTSSTSCPEVSDGAVSIVASGGTGTYAFAWSNGSDQMNQTDLAPGAYSITITDENGCTKSLEGITVDALPAMTASLAQGSNYSGFGVSCSDATDGSLMLTVDGASGEYSYNWSNGEQGSQLQNIGAGFYEVTITDITGCSTSASFTLTAPPPLTVEASLTSVVSGQGNADGAASVSATGGTGEYTYQWSTGETGASINELPEGEYCVTVTDQFSCSTTTCLQVITFGPVSSSINPSCAGNSDGSLVITAFGGEGPYNYSWEDENGTTITGNIEEGGVPTVIATGLSAGSYQVILSDVTGLNSSQLIVLTEPLALSFATSTVTDPSCVESCDGVIIIEGIGGTGERSINWSDGNQSFSRTGLCSGVYELVITDENNCQVSTSIELTAPDPITIQEQVGFQDCTNENSGFIIVNLSGGVEPLVPTWSTGESTTNVNNLSVGTYSLTVTDGNACSTSFVFELDNPSAIALNAEVTNISCPDTPDGTISINPEGTTGAYSISWSNGDTSSQITNLAVGDYSVVLTDEAGCEQTESYSITAPSPLVLSSETVDSDCFNTPNGEINLEVSGGIGPYNYSWSQPDLQGDQVFVPGGSYSVSVTDRNGCISESNFVIGQPQAFAVAITESQSPSCYGLADGYLEIVAEGDQGEYTYVWDSGVEGNVLDSVPGGIHIVSITDALGCTLEEQIELVQPDPIDPNIIITYGCGDGNVLVRLESIVGDGPFNYNWSTGASGTTLLSQMSAGDYWLEVEDVNGCVQTEEFTIEYVEPFELEYEVTPPTCPGDEDASINLTPIGGVTPYSFNWSTGATTQDLNSLAPGSYQISVTSGNCRQTVSIEVPNSAFDVQVTFTSNNEGTMDGQAVIAGGTDPYQITWSDGTIGEFIYGIQAGQEVMITIIDNNDCVYEETLSAILTSTTNALTNIGLKVYPNPTTGFVWIEVKTERFTSYDLNVLDINGRLLHQFKAVDEARKHIDLNNLPSGSYFLQVISNQFYGLKKVVKIE